MRAAFVANLDVERAWAGAPPVSARAQQRVAWLAPLTAALAPDDVTDLVLHGAADGTDVPGLPRWRPAPTPAGDDLAAWGARGARQRDAARSGSWRDAAWTARTSVAVARQVGDRRFAGAVADALPGAAFPSDAVTTVAQLTERVAALGGAWVAKAVHSAAGRDRCGHPAPVVPDDLARRAASLLQTFGALVVEPWVDRVLDVATCGVVRTADHVELLPLHRCHATPRGQFAGIDLRVPDDVAPFRAAIARAATAVGHALATAGLRGPFAVDSFVYRTGERIALRPIVEINPRYTFGHVAHALGERLGVAGLAFGTAPPAGAVPLIAATAAAPLAAWAYFAAPAAARVTT